MLWQPSPPRPYASSLARLWQQQGKRQDASVLLVPVYGWFTEDFLPFVDPNVSNFLPHLYDRLTTNPAGIIVGAIP